MNIELCDWILLAVYLGIITCFCIWAFRKTQEKKKLPDEEEKTVDEILNSKVPREKGHVTLVYNGYILQLTPEEWVMFNSWPRNRKRMFIRDFKKVEKKQ